MQSELSLPFSSIYGFLLVLARITGAFMFVPLPGINRSPDIARIVLSLSLTVAFFPLWPQIDSARVSFGVLVAWMLGEAAFGITVGLVVSFLLEAFQLAAQVMGLQAGYAYASMVDPNTQADSGILLVFSQLMAGLLFFTMGLDREVLRILGRSFETHPPGEFLLNRSAAEAIIRMGSGIFVTGLRLAMPAVALLVLIDISLALLGRLNQQLQLLTLAFPAKMLVGITVLSWIAALFPKVLRGHANGLLEQLSIVLSR